jgi:hypothetical protein
MVEGSAHDIRYAPLEFDGWRQTHWSHPRHAVPRRAARGVRCSFRSFLSLVSSDVIFF